MQLPYGNRIMNLWICDCDSSCHLVSLLLLLSCLIAGPGPAVWGGTVAGGASCKSSVISTPATERELRAEMASRSAEGPLPAASGCLLLFSSRHSDCVFPDLFLLNLPTWPAYLPCTACPSWIKLLQWIPVSVSIPATWVLTNRALHSLALVPFLQTTRALCCGSVCFGKS